MEKTLVSVIIPVYNGSNFLREAIDSVLNQTYKNYEIIVIDDGSTDDTWSIMESYGNLIRGYHKNNGGTASALNFGIQKMKGDWFAWLSHDDLWMVEKLETQILFHNHHNHLLGSYTNFIVVDEKKVKLEDHNCLPLNNSTTFRIEFLGNFIAGDTVLIHKKIFDDLGFFNEKLRLSQDYDMWLRIMHKYDLGVVPKPLTQIRSHPNQDSRKNLHLYNEEYKHLIIQNFESFNIRKLFDDFPYKNYNELQSYAYYWFANDICYRYGWPDIADDYYLKSLSLSRNTKTILLSKVKARRWFLIRNLIQLLVHPSRMMEKLKFVIYCSIQEYFNIKHRKISEDSKRSR